MLPNFQANMANLAGGVAPGSIAQYNPHQIRQDYAQAQRMQEMAQALSQQQPADTWYDLVANLIRGWQGAKMNKQADEKISSALERQFKYEQQQKRGEQTQARLQREAEAIADAKKREQDWKDKEREIRLRAELDGPKDNRTTLQKNYEFLSSLPPDQREAAMKARGGQTINVGDKGSPFDEALAKKQAQTFSQWEEESFNAQDTIATLDRLDQIAELQNTGRLQEAQGLIGQWFGTDAAANQQAYEGAVTQLVLKQANNLKGSLSEGELALLQQSVPSFGKDPRANKVVADVLRRGAQRRVDRFNQAQDWIANPENSGLRGFRPEFQESASDYSFLQDTNGAPQQSPTATATGPNGEKLGLVNGQWVPLNG